jgi:hypothetical protein
MHKITRSKTRHERKDPYPVEDVLDQAALEKMMNDVEPVAEDTSKRTLRRGIQFPAHARSAKKR